MLARLIILLALPLLIACAPGVTPVESDRIERGTALPPPGLIPPAR
ncbi:MAG: hypothetical protein JWP04_637 [Belnapia sp.]|jgi:hypothetical protein|nr:hypothetical protein [Belnapia sp.]